MPRTLVRHFFLAAALTMAAAGGCKRRPPAVPDAAAAPGRVVVVAHSFTGRTAVVGREFADMLGGRFDSFDDPPNGWTYRRKAGTRSWKQAARDLSLSGVEDVYLGFPIWDRMPTPQMLSFIAALDLKGKRVVPFYTTLHSVSPEGLAALAQDVRARGGAAAPPLGLRVPLYDSRSQVIEIAREGLHSRPDLWRPGRKEEVVRPDCRPHPARPEARLCRVPAGKAWVGHPRGDFQDMDESGLRLMDTAAFEIDETEVTAAEYQRCRKAGACPPPPCKDSLCLYSQGRLPQIGVSYNGAQDFCGWIGMRLPTLAEWTRAARADSLDPYPWGRDFKFGAGLGSFGPPGTTVTAEDSVPRDRSPLTAGCSFPKGRSPFGLCDMAGNAGELVDGHSLLGLKAGVVLVGGTYLDSDPSAFRVTSGFRFPKNLGMYLTGFRCAK